MDNSKLVGLGSRSGGKKGKSSANFPPITIKFKNQDEIPEDVKDLINNFLNCTSTEYQLAAVKSILDSLKQLENGSKKNIIKFLVQVIFESEPKHPVKCLLMRQVDQMENVHDIFMKHLSQIFLSYEIYCYHVEYSECAKLVTRLSSCFDNFHLFVRTVKNIALKVFRLIYGCLSCCIDNLSYHQLSTTEYLEISKVIHQTLHLYLNVFQKVILDENQTHQQIINMSCLMSKLVLNNDISMDSKALCAVIEVTMRRSVGNWSHPWMFGYPGIYDWPYTQYWQQEDRAMLCLYYALITSAPNDVARRLDFASSSKVAEHILTLIKNVVSITDRLSGSVSVTLCGARALAAVAGWLKNAGPKGNKSHSNLDESDLNKNEFDSNKNESDPNTDESDLNENESDPNTDESDLNENESDPNTDESDLNENESDPNTDESDLNENESDPNTDESDLNENESNPESESDPDIPDPWSYSEPKYKEGEVYMGRTLEVSRLLSRFAGRRVQHHVPGVRHLAEQILVDVMMYSLRYHPQEVKGWLKVEGGLGRGQMALLRRVGGPLLRDLVAPSALLPHLHSDHKQPHVAALLDTYLEKDCSDLNSERVFVRWFVPVLEFVRRPLSSVITDVLIKLLAKAIDIQDQLITSVFPLVQSPDATTPANLKCSLFILNVISKSNASKKYQDSDDKWKGLISYDVLEAAILDDDDQIVRLCTSVAWHGCAGARVVLAFVRDGAHRPRALHVDTLRALTQFLNRLEKDYRSCNDNNKAEMYEEILHKLRSICISNLIRGANHYRRGIALFLLKAIAGVELQGNGSEWSLDEVETVLSHLDDSYDTNKQMALDILKTCPQTLLREAVLSNNMASIPSLLEEVSYRVRDAEGAAYKLELLVTTLPDIVLAYPRTNMREKIECVRYAACAAALDLSERAPAAAARRVAALTLLRTQLERVPLTCHDDRGQTRRLSDLSNEWYQLARRAIDCALVALDDAAPLVEAPSPEGLVPYIFFEKVVEPHPYEPHLYMVGEEVMTSQTMLLYAWTCAKEAWLIVGRACQFVKWGVLCGVWDTLAACVARARHRAVHEHATRAYGALLRRLSELPLCSGVVAKVGQLAVNWVAKADGTRRAAGLAGLVLAIATARPDLKYIDITLLTDTHQTGAHHAGMALLRARETARAAHDVLPALVRHALHDADSPDAALQWACVGVVGAGVRRMAGAHAPGGGGGAPGERGRLRTSVFMSRYPGLYQYILECVERATVREKSMCASVACALLLLARLLPDADDAAPHVTAGVEAACASGSYHTRRLAAAAAAANLPSNMYVEHAAVVLNTLSKKDTPKNLCHGLILRLLAMLDEDRELPWAGVFARGLPPTLWIVDSPCFPLVHEYLNLIIVLIQRYPSCLEAGYRAALGEGCGRAALGRVPPGAQPCAARALVVAAALLDPPQAAALITNGLDSPVYEVCLASLECLISARGEGEGEGESPLRVSSAVWGAPGAGRPALVGRVARVLHAHAHIACRQRALHVLLLEGAYAHVFGEDRPSWYGGTLESWVVERLCSGMESCGTLPWRSRVLYARALTTLLHTVRANDIPSRCIERVAACVWAESPAGRGTSGTRDELRDLLQHHYQYLLTFDDDSLKISLLLVAASARLSEGGYPGRGRVVPPAPAPALLLALALLDFGLADQTIDDQYQTFDEVDSEVYEEAIWTDRCTDMLVENYAQTNPGLTITPYVLSLIKKYNTLDTVCGIHLYNFQKLLNGETDISNLHDKVELFDNKLKAFDASIHIST